jgi:integrase/recombinase XerD
MKIQIWRRRDIKKEKNNLYIRYRLSQNKANVESLKLWEWIRPKNTNQIEHNNNVKRAYNEIIRRKKDDIENNREIIPFTNINTDEFEYTFKKYSKIKNTNAIINFIQKVDTKIKSKKIKTINTGYLKKLKSEIEKKITIEEIKGTTASKYWNNFKKGLIELNENKLCEYPKIGGIKFLKKTTKIMMFTNKEIDILSKSLPEKWKDLKKAFFFSYNTGLRIGNITRLKWKNIYTIKNKKKKTHYYKIDNKKRTMLINSFPVYIREMIGKRKTDDEFVFRLPDKQANRSKIFKEWMKKSGIDQNKKYNDSINNYAIDLFNETKNIYKVSAALGHNSIYKTKEIYSYMENYNFIENEEIVINKRKKLSEKINKKNLFKKGNLLSYRKIIKDTI